MSEFSEWYLDEITWVSEEEWPFEGMPVSDSLDMANRLAPSGCWWVYSVADEPGYHLVHQKREVDGDE